MADWSHDHDNKVTLDIEISDNFIHKKILMLKGTVTFETT